jgi:quercetin dioxygenase-like cupin family protein
VTDIVSLHPQPLARNVSPLQPLFASLVSDICKPQHLAMGLGAASLLVFRTPSVEAAVGDERELAKGVKERILGEGPAMIPGYSKVSMRDVMFEPGATSPANPMKNAMVCHITQGELKVTQDGKDFVAKKDHVWTCAKGTTTEGATNAGTTVAIMRITDLLET